jgi:hypothetical protein
MEGRCQTPEKHSHTIPEGRGYWLTENLWAAAAQLPVKRVRIDDVAEFNRDCWFGDRHAASIRNVAEHARRISDADLTHPIILSSDGRLLDGGHRLAKAYLAGQVEVLAVQFDKDPDPDWVEATKAGGGPP